MERRQQPTPLPKAKTKKRKLPEEERSVLMWLMERMEEMARRSRKRSSTLCAGHIERSVGKENPVGEKGIYSFSGKGFIIGNFNLTKAKWQQSAHTDLLHLKWKSCWPDNREICGVMRVLTRHRSGGRTNGVCVKIVPIFFPPAAAGPAIGGID